MRQWTCLLLVSVISALAVGCASKDAPPFIEPPDMMEQLANANLKAPGPINAGGNAPQYRSAGHTVSDLDHGDDAIAGPPTPKPAGISDQRGGYELNFNEAELSELSKVILQDTLSIPYVYDPRVQGRVTVSTGGPVSRTEILSLLETVLAMNRAALIVEGNLYRIVPDVEGRPEIATSFNYARERQEIGPGYGVSIIPLKFVSTDTMTRMLSSLGTRPGGVRASVMNNLLVIRGTGRERQSLLEVAMMFDVDWMRGQSAGLFTLANATPDEIIKSLHEVFRTEGQGKDLIRFQSIARLNAILVLTQKADLLDKAEEWVMRLDRTSTEGDDFYVYRVENGKAKDLAQVLNASFSGGGGISRKAEEAEVGPNHAAHLTETKAAAAETALSAGADQAVSAELDVNAFRSDRNGVGFRRKRVRWNRDRATFASRPTRATTHCSLRRRQGNIGRSSAFCAASIGQPCRS